MPRPRLFVSAVSSELSGARRRAAAVLNSLGYDTVSEEGFPTGYGELRRWLAEQIDGCEGVIQLVGKAYGAEPPPSDDPAHPWPDPQLGRCSYTQYELLYAWRRDKRTWVILMGPDFPRDRPPEALDLPPPDQPLPDPAAYQAERRALQRAYVERLTRENHLRHGAASATELENLLLKLKDELAALRADELAFRQRLETRLDQAARITTERIRAHLLEAVEAAYRRDLAAAEAPGDWQARERLRQAAEAQRHTQLARVDDLADSFAEIERKGTATSVLKELTRILREQGVPQALAYMETQRPGILERVRARQAAARGRDRAELEPLLTSARLYATQGQGEPARQRYDEVLELAPDWPAALDASRWFLTEQGDQAMIRGGLTSAKQDFLEAQARAQRLLELEPGNPEWRRNMAASWSWIGDVEAALGHGAAALTAYQRCYNDIAGLAAADPSNAGWQRDRSVSLERIGDIKSAQGDLAGALTAYEQSQGIRERLAAADPSNAGWQRDLSVSLEKIGDSKSAQGDLAGALAAYEQSQGIRERLAATDPSNAGWQRDLSVSLERIGDSKSAQGDLAGALAAYEESQGIAERLAAADPSNAGWQRDLAVSHFKVGVVAQQQGRGDLVRSHWGAMLAIFDDLDRRGLHISASDRAGLDEIRKQVAAPEADGDAGGAETP